MDKKIKDLIEKGFTKSLNYEEIDFLKKEYSKLNQEQKDQINLIFLKEQLSLIEHDTNSIKDIHHDMVILLKDSNESQKSIYNNQEKLLKKINILIGLFIFLIIVVLLKIF